MTGLALAPRIPVAFAGTTGLLDMAGGDVGVVICEPWGYEAQCARRALRVLSDRLSALGCPVLRYDQPGSGDALAAGADIGGLAPFDAALAAACETLLSGTRATRLVLVGLGLGAALCLRHAVSHPQTVAGLVLLAPPAKGRVWLRELQARAVMIGEVTGSAPAPGPGEALRIAGLPMSQALADELRALDLTAPDDMPACPVLALAREGRAAEGALCEMLAAETGSEAGIMSGYDELMTDPTGSLVPEADFARVLSWVQRLLPQADAAPAGNGAATPPAARLAGPSFTETLCLFGPQEAMVGVWCAPARSDPQALPVMLLNAGGNPRAGWARGGVELARSLAASGIASFRFDIADIGDSRPLPDGPAVVHYHAGLPAQLSAAIDLCEAMGGGDRVVVAGNCGGAYLALNGALTDTRIAHVVAVNLQRFLWDPRDDVAEVLRFGHSSASEYGRKLFSAEKWKRVLAGKSDPLGILRSLAVRAWRQGERRLAPWLFGLAPFSRLYRQVHANLAALALRGVAIVLVFSEGDPGLAQLDTFFGEGWKRLAAYPNIEVAMIPDADHNLTPDAARLALREQVIGAALAEATSEAAGAQPAA
ncbi:alpha/beta fold hydrolase [Stappia sp. WLB 29]|uniref:alpha/beta hydrolase n=1 Tax=Stappia sp. WLB 29 TaxID=2925220 RepID=UPI0020C14A5A|nr:alpha/beta fold hydrolase [Stappia sp. WLB 29]